MNKEEQNPTTLLAQKAVMVRLVTGQWSGKKVSKKAKTAIAKEFGGKADAYFASLNLTGNPDRGWNPDSYFRGITSKFKREHFHRLTYPWDDVSTAQGGKGDGYRLCPTNKIDQLQSAFNEAKIEWDREVDGFIKNLAKIKADAKIDLGDLYNDNHYPQDVHRWDSNKGKYVVVKTADEVMRDKFTFELHQMFVDQVVDPSDIRLEVSDEMKERLINETENRIRNNLINVGQIAVDEVVQNITEFTDKVRKFNSAKGKRREGGFYKTNAPKIQKSLSALAQLNEEILGNDPTIEKVHQDLVAKVAKLCDEKYFDSIKEDTDEAKAERVKVADGLDEPLQDLNKDFLSKAFGGGNDD